MNGNTHSIRRVITGLVLAISLAALVAPQALAGGNSRYGPLDHWALFYLASHNKASTVQRYGAPDGWYPYAVSLTRASLSVAFDGRSPDTKDAALAAQQEALAPVDGRSPDTLDAAQTAQARLLTPNDGRSPDTIDAAVQAHIPITTVFRSSGFEWGDFGIGVASALGVMLLLGISMRSLTARQSRKQPRPVATA